MPEAHATPQMPFVSLEDTPLKTGLQDLEDAAALQLVRETFANYENYRGQNQEQRWKTADRLYTAFKERKNWEGTSVPRAAIANPIVFDQIEAALPIIEQSIFSGPEWFQVEAQGETAPQEARAVQAKLSYDLEHPKDNLGTSSRNELSTAFKSGLLYGNGGIAMHWDATKRRSIVEWVDIRDVYIDPGTPTPNIEDARSVIRRKWMTVDELDALRGDAQLNIPSKHVLVFMSMNPQTAYADSTRQVQAAFRGVNWDASNTNVWSPNPADKRIEVLVYYSKTRIIWTLNREWVSYNGKNPYGFYPLTFAPCYNFPGHFYAMSMPDVLEYNQVYSEDLLNKHLDELSLALDPPKTMKRSGLVLPSAQKYRPGNVVLVDDPAKDYVLQFPQGATANVWNEIQYLEIAAEKRTGVNSASQGSPRPGNVNRTATGVQSQINGGNSRLYYLVKNIEDYLITPMLYKMYEMTRYHAAPDETFPVQGGGDNKFISVGAAAFARPVGFKMLAASKMMSREKLAQILPFVSQYFLNGQFINQLHTVGKTVDFEEFTNYIQDAVGTSKLYSFVRQMTPQEQQAAQQPPPEIQARMQEAQLKSQTELQKEQIKKQPDPNAQMQAQQEMQLKQAEAQSKMEMEREIAMIKADAERAKAEMTIQLKKMELQIKEQEMNMKIRASMMDHQQGMQQMSEKANLESQLGIASHMQEKAMGEDQHSQAMAIGDDKHEQAMSHAEDKNRVMLKKSEAGINKARPNKEK